MPKSKQRIPKNAEFSCPDCAGVLSLDSVDDGRHRTYRCQVGHRFSTRSLLDAKEIEVERTLWAAAVTLHHVTEVYDRMLRELPDATRMDRSRLQRRSREARQQKQAVIRIIESTHAWE